MSQNSDNIIRVHNILKSSIELIMNIAFLGFFFSVDREMMIGKLLHNEASHEAEKMHIFMLNAVERAAHQACCTPDQAKKA